MSTGHPLSQLEFTKRTAKRAQYEAFEFILDPTGVRVRNCSHANPEAHEYVVTVVDGIPSACTCPADARFEGACKHRVVVAIRRPLLDAVTNTVAADGGTITESIDATDETEECADCLEDFPCWACVESGRRALPE